MTADPTWTPPTVHAGGDRAIAVGRDAVASIFSTGDHNQFFVGQYERLADAYLQPWSLYRELALDRFTGREWLVRDIDDFLHKKDRGYFVLEGGVGVGKTTFLAWLARERGYVHHFVRLLQGDHDVGITLRNLCAQLIRSWDLNSRAIGGVLPAAASRPDFFYDTLYEAAQRRDELRPGEPIVIVVDGLNEVEPEPAPHQNVLALPASLPPGVYFIVSQRNTYVPLIVKAPRQIVNLSATRSENLADMRAFLRAAASRPGIRGSLESEGITADAFVDMLMSACGGVWIYLYYLMADIESGARSVTELDTLPAGLWQYYAQYWLTWQQERGAEWRSLDQPLLNTVAAARESLPASLLGSMAGIEDTDQLSLLLEESWRPFLQVDDTAEEHLYGIFHASLREFLEGQVDLTTLTSAEGAVVRRMAISTRAAHSRIADRYLTTWGGLDTGVPGLRDPAKARCDGGYGLRHLTEHLVAAHREEELHRLLWIGWGSDAVPEAPGGHVVNAWREAHERAATLSDYVNDVNRAWILAEHHSQRALTAGETPASIRLELRYALLAASVSSLAANIPPALLLALFQRGRLPANEAVAYARRGPDALGRSEALLALATALPEPRRSDLLLEALGAARAVDDEQWRTGALARIIPYLTERGRPDAEAVALTIVDDYWRAAALGAVDELIGTGRPAGSDAPERDPGDESWYSPELAVPHAIAVAQVIEHRQAEVLARLTARLPQQPTEGDLQRALETVRPIPHDRWRAEALTSLAALLAGDLRDEVLDDALTAARAVGDSEEHGQALAALSQHLATLRRPQESIATAMQIPDPYRRTQALADLAESLAGPVRPAARQATLEALPRISDPVLRARVLLRHPTLAVSEAPPRSPDLAVLATITGEYWRAAVLAGLTPVLDPEPAERALREAFGVVASLPDPHRRAGLLARFAPQLPHSLIDRAMELATVVVEADDRGRLSAALAPRLLELGRVDEALSTAERIEDEYWRAGTLRRLTAALSRADRTADGLRTARSIPYLHWRAEALAELATTMDGADREAAVAEALAVARSPEDDGWKAEALARLALYLPDEERAAAFGEALDAARRLDQPHARWHALASLAGFLATAGLARDSLAQTDVIADHYWKADALVRIAPALPPELLGDALDRAAGIAHQRERARVFGALLPRFGDFPPVELHAVWRDTLHLLGTGTRQELLLALPGLLPALSRLGGPDAMVECAQIVESVRRWWP